MQINVTRFIREAAPMDYSASVAEIGANAGPDTWRAACDDSTEFMFLDTDDKRDAFRKWVCDSGGWSDDEIRAWSDIELNALFIQWVSGDMRECNIGPDMSHENWQEVEALQMQGVSPSNLWRDSESGEVYFSLEN